MPTVMPVTPRPSFHSPVLVGGDIDFASDDTLVQSPILLRPNPLFETGQNNCPTSGRLRNFDIEWTTLSPKISKKIIASTLQRPRKKNIKPTAGDHIHLSVDADSIARRYPQSRTLKRHVRNYVHFGTGNSPIISSSVVKCFGLLRPCLEFRVVGVFSQTPIVRWEENR
jgi:hypothetical protein